MSELDDVAKELQEQFDQGTWYEALIPHFADVIDVAHHPKPGHTDGPTAAPDLIANMRGDHFGPVLRASRQVAERISVEGNAITAVQTMVGEFHDGTEIRVPLTQVFTFRDGRLVNIDHYTNPADTDALMAAMAAAAEAAKPSA
jgi:hypothetical protein